MQLNKLLQFKLNTLPFRCFEKKGSHLSVCKDVVVAYVVSNVTENVVQRHKTSLLEGRTRGRAAFFGTVEDENLHATSRGKLARLKNGVRKYVCVNGVTLLTKGKLTNIRKQMSPFYLNFDLNLNVEVNEVFTGEERILKVLYKYYKVYKFERDIQKGGIKTVRRFKCTILVMKLSYNPCFYLLFIHWCIIMSRLERFLSITQPNLLKLCKCGTFNLLSYGLCRLRDLLSTLRGRYQYQHHSQGEQQGRQGQHIDALYLEERCYLWPNEPGHKLNCMWTCFIASSQWAIAKNVVLTPFYFFVFFQCILSHCASNYISTYILCDSKIDAYIYYCSSCDSIVYNKQASDLFACASSFQFLSVRLVRTSSSLLVSCLGRSFLMECLNIIEIHTRFTISYKYSQHHYKPGGEVSGVNNCESFYGHSGIPKVILHLMNLLLLCGDIESNPGPADTKNGVLELTLMTQNCRGLQDRNKLRSLIVNKNNEAKKGKMVLALQETHLMNDDLIKWSGNYVISNSISPHSAGCVTYFNDYVRIVEVRQIDDCGHGHVVVVEGLTVHTTIIANVYSPVRSLAREQKRF